LLAARTQYAPIAEKLTPRVRALLDEYESPAAVADRIAADPGAPGLTERQRQIAQQLLLTESAFHPMSGDGAGGPSTAE
jgi:hypothetical protein